MAFRDVNPVAPKHILVIPRKPITQLAATSEDDILVSVQFVLVGVEQIKSGLPKSDFFTWFDLPMGLKGFNTPLPPLTLSFKIVTSINIS